MVFWRHFSAGANLKPLTMSLAASATGDYATGLAAYRRGLSNLGLPLDASDVRIEVQFESLRDWSRLHTFEEVRGWFERQRADCTMIVEDIPIHACAGWRVDPDSGWVRREDGEFFFVQGVRVRHSSDREVGGKGWDQPILTQVGYDGGIVGLIRMRFDGVPHYLVEAKAEPGNYERVQMSPTLQATFSNLRRAHGGKKPRFAEFFETPEEPGATVLYRQWLSEDGGRLHKKRNLGMLVEIPPGTPLEVGPTFLWMSMWQIKQCLLENAWVNPHVRGIIAHL